MAGGARVTSRGIGRGMEDSAGETLDKLMDALEDIWAGRGDGHNRYDRYMACRSYSGIEEV